jgi:hypothetical protein
MSLFQKIADLLTPDNEIVGTGNNLQEALEDYAQKAKRLDPHREITSIDVGETDENGKDIPWFTLRLKR